MLRRSLALLRPVKITQVPPIGIGCLGRLVKDGWPRGGFLCNAWFDALRPFFSVSPLVKLSVANRGGVGKGGSCVLIPDLVVMVKVGALDFGVSLLLIIESI
ncbi:hypothetical protein Tco_1508627 [Tanacetum coccineum]